MRFFPLIPLATFRVVPYESSLARLSTNMFKFSTTAAAYGAEQAETFSRIERFDEEHDCVT